MHSPITNVLQHKIKKTKARFSRLVQHLAWKGEPILVLALHKSVSYLLT